MITTRVVLAVTAFPVFLGAVVALRRDRRDVALWLLAGGSALATVWAGLSVVWAINYDASFPAETYLVLAVTGALTTYYFVRTALDERFVQ